jgi:hypothetical protein
MTLHEQCVAAVGSFVIVKGTNGDEYSEKHGEQLEITGWCTAYHDSHGLCVIVTDIDDVEWCIDPVEIKIYNYIGP